MKQLSIGDLVSRAWDFSVKHWPVFIIIAIIENALGSLTSGDPTAFTMLGQNPDPREVVEALNSAYNPLRIAIVVLIMTYLSIITYRMLVNTITKGRPYEEGALLEALKVDLTTYGFFLGVELVLGMALIFGFLLFIIPGIILSVRWWFTPLIAATENVSLRQAFGRSWEITRGHFWELFLLGIVCFGIVIVGFCACCVGVIFAEVVVKFIGVLAYQDLGGLDATQE